MRRTPALTPDKCAYGIPFSLAARKCYFKKCIPPSVPPSPPVNSYWNDPSLWNTSSDGYLINVGGSVGVPKDYDDVRIVLGELGYDLTTRSTF